MTAQPLLLTAASAKTLSDSSSSISDEVETTALLARITNLSAFLLTDVSPVDLNPTKRVELTIKLMTLEHRVLIQRNQERKLALQSETSTKQPARRGSHSTPQPLAVTEAINDPVQPIEEVEPLACFDPAQSAASFSLEPFSTIDETGESADDAAEIQPPTTTSPIDATSSNVAGEQTAVSEVREPEQTSTHLPLSPSDTDQFPEAVSQEDAIRAPQDGSQAEKTKTLVVEKKVVAKQKTVNKKKSSSVGKKTFSHSRPVKLKRRK